MSRFSPTVVPTWGRDLGAALNGGVDSFLRARRQRQEDDRQQTHDDLALYGAGLEAVPPDAVAKALPSGPLPPMPGTPTGAPDPQLIAQALQNHVAGGHTLSRPPVTLGGKQYRLTAEREAQIAQARQVAELDRASRTATLRKEGYVPDSERVPGATTGLSGRAIDQVVGVSAPALSAALGGHPDALTPRYGQSTGGFSYDTQSPAAQRERLGLDLTRSQITRNNRPPVHAPLMGSPEWVAAQRELENIRTGAHQSRRLFDVAHPLPARESNGEPAAVVSTRKDLTATEHQQVRGEQSLKNLKSERRSLLNDHPRANRDLSEQRTAADSSIAKQYGELGRQIESAQSRVGRLTASADSIRGVLSRQRGPSIPDHEITDQEIQEALDAGVDPNEDAVRAHVAQRRGIP